MKLTDKGEHWLDLALAFGAILFTATVLYVAASIGWQ